VKEAFNAKRTLSRQEFLQVLVRIAVVRYMKQGAKGNLGVMRVADAVRMLLAEQIQAHLEPAALQVSNAFRVGCVYTPEVDAVLREHHETVHALYAVYACGGSNKGDVLNDDALMSHEEWVHMCHDLQLIDTEFTHRECTLCFVWSRIRVCNEADTHQRKRIVNLLFEDFLEALTRLCTMKCLPTDDEVDECGFEDGGQSAFRMIDSMAAPPYLLSLSRSLVLSLSRSPYYESAQPLQKTPQIYSAYVDDNY
jgi:hypothetical protein